MKKLILVSIFNLLVSISFSQTWQWARHLGSDGWFNSTNSERANNVITDGTNYYVIGSYDHYLYMPSDTIYSNGLNDIFIVKFDASGNELWSKTLGGNYNMPDDNENAFGVYDSIGNCLYIGGVFISSINFGGSISLSSPQSYGSTIFLAKMDLNGNFIWAKKGGGPGIDKANVYISPQEKIYLVTQSDDSSFFDNFNLGPGGGIIQYDTSGTCLSAAIKFTHTTFATINNVYLDFINTDLIIYGLYRSDTFQLDTATLINKGASDAFLARADSNGNIKWIKSFGNGGIDYFQSLSIDNSDNLYVTGGFQDSIDLGGGNLTNNGKDILIGMFDSNGNNTWTKQVFGSGSTQGGSKIICAGDGNCYIIGLFSGSASFGTYNVSTTNLYDMFLTRYDNNGDCLGIRQFGTAGGTCLAVDNSGNVVCGGGFINTVNIGSNTFTAYQASDIYIAKIDAFTGIGGEERNTNNQLIIYANPNAGKCNITVPDDFLQEKNLTLIIYDNTGKVIQQKKLTMNDGKIKLNLEAEAKGVYNVTLSNGKKSYNGKIVFE